MSSTSYFNLTNPWERKNKYFDRTDVDKAYHYYYYYYYNFDKLGKAKLMIYCLKKKNGPTTLHVCMDFSVGSNGV